MLSLKEIINNKWEISVVSQYVDLLLLCFICFVPEILLSKSISVEQKLPDIRGAFYYVRCYQAKTSVVHICCECY